MKKKQRQLLTIAAAAVMGFQPVMARQISSAEALDRAIKSEQSVPAGMRLATNGSKLKLLHTALAADGDQAAYYVFGSERPDGFVIASADDRLQPILGIAESGLFSELPDNVKWWLGQYEAEISAYYAENGTDGDFSLTSVYDNYDSWGPIEPICKTRWNQHAPYNLLCPEVNGSRSVTGCVATCLAQAVKAIGYFNGSGLRTYTTNGVTVTFDFGSYKPDFSKMRDSYDDGGASEAECQEVAKLMLACGVAVGTSYNYVSGASIDVNAIRQYMGFDNETFTMQRNGLTSAEWESLCYSLIKAGKPICYFGSGSGGHAFICDGYSEDGFFHFNWGWGGTADGYFRLSSLNPRQIGTGGFSGGYTMEQRIVVLMTPDDEKLDLPVFHPGQVTWEDRYALMPPSLNGDSYTFDRFTYQLTCEAYGKPMEVGIGLLLENRDGVSEDVYIAPSAYNMCQHNIPRTGFTVCIPTDLLPAGAQYDAYPVYSFNGWKGYWKLLPWEPSNYQDHYLAKVNSNGRVDFSVAEMAAPKLAVSGMEVNEFYAGDNNNTFKCLITNFGEDDFSEKLTLGLYKEDGITKTKDIAKIYMLLGSGETLTLNANVATTGLDAGKYELCLYRSSYRIPLTETSKIGVEIKSGKRPDGAVVAGPSGTYEVSFWINGARRPMSAASMTLGGEFSGVTSVIATASQSVEYSLAFFRHGETTDPIVKYPIAKTDIRGTDEWLEGTAFSIRPALEIGAYTMAFVDADNQPVSYAADFCVGTEHDGIVYDYDIASAGLTVAGGRGTLAAEVVIPAELGGVPVTGVADGAFDRVCGSLESLILPASVNSIGLHAFRHASALRYVRFGSTAGAPFASSAIAFSSVNPAVEFYVPAEGFAAYAPAFRYRGRLYAEISSVTLPAEAVAEVGKELRIEVALSPDANVNRNFIVEVSNPSVLDALIEGSTLVIAPLTEGEAKVRLTSGQPGVEPAEVLVRVGAESSISETDVDSAAEFFDLTGRRLLAPQKGAIAVVRQKGTASVVKL